MRKHSIINLGIWVALVLLIAICGVIVSYSQLALSVRHQTTRGVVDEKFPDNHLGYSFSYKVDGHRFGGRGYLPDLRSFDAVRLGDTVTVIYDPLNPASYTLDAPTVLLVRTVGQIVAACVVLSALGFFIIKDYVKIPAA
jgi:hypothetical protein